MTKELITIPEFLAKFSISRTAFYREVNKGLIPTIKRGKRTLIAWDDAQAWLSSLRAK